MRNVEVLFGQQKARSSAHSASALVAALILLLGVVGSALFARALAAQNSLEYAGRLAQQSTAIRTYSMDAVRGYDRLLYSAAALIKSKPDLTEEDWRQFYNNLQIKTQYPDTLGFGYTHHFHADELEAYTEKIRATGHPEFTVTPTTPREEYTAIQFLEPFNEANQKAHGYDMYSEQNRQIAMANARDHATAAMSSPVHLKQDEGTKNPPIGVLIFYHVYRTATIPDSVDERREQLEGYVYIAARPSDILQSYLQRTPDTTEDSDVMLYDTTGEESVLLFSIDNSPADRNQQQKSVRTFSLDNRQWSVVVAGRNSSINRFIGPSAILALGSLVSTAIAFGVFAALLVRLEKVEQSYGKEVQKTKDELLALASHQLRTPASGVKQYLGMLVQGFVGELSEKQREIAQKAYDANERQLEIINELLYVSKADAGQLMIEPTDVDLAQMTRNIVEGFQERAKQKDIQLIFSNVTPRYVSLDSRFGAMLIENLISNAIKYSKPSNKVHIRLKDRGDFVALAITDHGVGISEEDMPKIFNKFQRVENELSQTEGGSGLGLFLANQLARSHGGDIEVESKVGVGSVFTLLLPKKSSLKHATVSLRASSEKARKGGRSK